MDFFFFSGRRSKWKSVNEKFVPRAARFQLLRAAGGPAGDSGRGEPA